MENVKVKEGSFYTLLGYSHKNKYYIKYYDVICVCGKSNKLTTQELKKNLSCGCKKDYEHIKTHGFSRTSEYKSWQSMKDRCYNKNNPSFKDYGDRNINVCDEWLNSFECFINDMGKKPSKKHSIERLDVNKGYSKDNCIWATNKQQANNRRCNYLLTYKNITKTRSEWADIIGVNVRTIASRCRANKPIEQILKEYKI
jgi:hypothetical protein